MSKELPPVQGVAASLPTKIPPPCREVPVVSYIPKVIIAVAVVLVSLLTIYKLVFAPSKEPPITLLVCNPTTTKLDVKLPSFLTLPPLVSPITELLPTNKLPAMPTPPVTINAPVVVEVALVELLTDTTPVAGFILNVDVVTNEKLVAV
jgi:hypothetical protein